LGTLTWVQVTVVALFIGWGTYGRQLANTIERSVRGVIVETCYEFSKWIQKETWLHVLKTCAVEWATNEVDLSVQREVLAHGVRAL